MNVLLEGANLIRILGGLWVSFRIALISMALSLVIGIFFGMFLSLKNPLSKFIGRIYLEFARLTPQIVLLFLAYFGLTRVFGINLSGEAAAILAFSAWGTAEMGDLVRGAIGSISKVQYEAGYALGLTRFQVFISVILPQCIKRLIPPAVNLVTRMIKTTSLVTLIGMTEVLKVSKQIIEANRFKEPKLALFIYGVVFFLYFAVCFPISKLSAYLEKKWA